MEIKLFPGTAREYERGGIVLSPLFASMTEEAGGAWHLTLTLTRAQAKVTCGSIIACPAPVKHMPLKTVYRDRGEMECYSAVGAVRQYTSHLPHTFGGYTYTEEMVSVQRLDVPVYAQESANTKAWFFIRHGTQVTLLDDTAERWLCLCPDGRAGYIDPEALHYSGKKTADVWKESVLRPQSSQYQPFRVERITEETPGVRRIEARHIYFDAAAPAIADKEFINVPLGEVCDYLTAQNGYIRFRAGCDQYVSIPAEKNSVYTAARLCEQYRLQLIRDGREAFLLPGDNTERVHTTQTGLDLIRLSVTRDDSEVITRFIPCTDTAEYPPVDSPHLEKYPLVRSMRVYGRTRQDALEKIEQYMQDDWDTPEEVISVRCVPDSLQHVSLYDTLQIRNGIL